MVSLEWGRAAGLKGITKTRHTLAYESEHYTSMRPSLIHAFFKLVWYLLPLTYCLTVGDQPQILPSENIPGEHGHHDIPQAFVRDTEDEGGAAWEGPPPPGT